LSVARYDAVGGYQFEGYMDDFRIMPCAVYSSNFTVPTVALSTSVTGTRYYSSMLLLGLNSSQIINQQVDDLSDYDRTVTMYGGAAISTAVKQFGAGSMQFNGTSSYILTPNSSAFDFRTSDFTIECWVYPTSNSGGANFGGNLYKGLVSQNQTGTDENASMGLQLFNMRPEGVLFLAAGGVTGVVTATNAIPINSWTHIAYCRSGSQTLLYVNGVLAATGTISGPLKSSTRPLAIGSDSVGNCLFDGYIDDVRVVKGHAVYTSNFTPPTAALTAISEQV
jgi:hypothetical protein